MREEKNRAAAGVSPPEEIDVAALYEQLRAELRRGPSDGDPAGAGMAAARALAARFWPAAAVPDYFAFESRMRGSVESVRERQRGYVDDFRGQAPVLDVGCGRGELVALLGEAGVEARGIDADADMVAYARGERLDVEQADAVLYLEGVTDGSLGGIFVGQ